MSNDETKFNLDMAREHKDAGELFDQAYIEFRTAAALDPTLRQEIKAAWAPGSFLMGWWASQRRRR